MTGVASCKHCDARIRFVELEPSKSLIPVELLPDPAGNVAANWQGTSLIGHMITEKAPAKPGQKTYMPHRKVCHPDRPLVRAGQRAPSLFDTTQEA